MAWVLGLYRDCLQLSLDTGDPCREPSETTESLSEKPLSRSRPDLASEGEGPPRPEAELLGGEGDLLVAPLAPPLRELE